MQSIALPYFFWNETTAVIFDLHLSPLRVSAAADSYPLGASVASHVRQRLLDDTERLHPPSDVEADALQDVLFVNKLCLDLALLREARDIFGHDDIERAIDVG
jgi:hypothetical protein